MRYLLNLIIFFTSIPSCVLSAQDLPKTIHVFVALCDNKYQGIVPVPAGIGNGQNANTNLYWGCAFGVRTFFKKSNDWTFIESRKVDATVHERLIFKHKEKNIFLVADAYDGRMIQKCITEFLYSCSGKMKDTLVSGRTTLGLFGNASLVAYVGHDGLMDFELDPTFENTDGKTRDCIILACYSRNYFKEHIQASKANPLVWTTGLMCPEAYTLEAALAGSVNDESKDQICDRAAKAYAKYQKCSEKAAKNLLVN